MVRKRLLHNTHRSRISHDLTDVKQLATFLDREGIQGRTTVTTAHTGPKYGVVVHLTAKVNEWHYTTA